MEFDDALRKPRGYTARIPIVLVRSSGDVGEEAPGDYRIITSMSEPEV